MPRRTMLSHVPHAVRIAPVALLAALACAQASGATVSEPVETGSEASLWVDELPPEWFAEHWRAGSPVHAAALGETDEAERLDAIDETLRRRAATAGLPQKFVSQGWALRRFRDGEIQINDYPPIPWRVPVDWHRPRPEVDESYFAELHSWRFMTQLLQEYRATGEPELLAAVEEIAEDWIRQNPFPRGAHRRAWHEGAVMKRTLVLINWLDTLAARPAPERERFRPYQVAALLVQHVEFLLLPDTYTGVGNHGMRQDLVLIVASFALPDAYLGDEPRRTADAWRDLALERLEEIQIGRGFTRSGIWREHSPTYHRYVAGILDLVRQALRANRAPVPPRLDWLLDHRELYLAHVFTPAARYPPVGDTGEERLPRHIVETPELLFSVTGGHEGRPPATVDGFFPEAGEAVLRDRWGATPEEHARSLYLHLHAAQHLPMGHRHQDDLSFVLHNGGRWWIVEGGRHGYGRNAWRAHVVSAWAHNGVILDRIPLGATERSDLEAGIEEGVATEDVAAVRAWSERFRRAGARVDRIVVLLRKASTVLLVDRMAAPGGGSWQGLLHLAPDLAVRPSAPGGGAPSFEVSAPDTDLTLDLLFHPATTNMVEIQRGLEGATGPRPGRGGWISPAPREMVPTSALSARRTGDRVVTPTLLAFRGAGDEAPQELEISPLDGGIYEISWRVGEERSSVRVAFDGAPVRALDGEPVAGAMAPSALVAAEP